MRACCYFFFSLPIKFLSLFLRLYNKVIVLTEKDATLLKSWKLKAEVIVNPVKHQNIEKNKKPHCCCRGAADRSKGMELLLNNWSSFIEDNPTWRLDIAGEGELEHELKQQAENWD